MLLHVYQMFREALTGIDAILRAADGPKKDHARDNFRMSNSQRQHWTTSHTAAHKVRVFDIQMVQQSFALCGVMPPCHSFDAPAGLSALAPVKDDAGIFLRQVLENLDLWVNS